MNKNALIVGAGSGLSAALARALSKDGYSCTLAARNVDKLAALCKETGATSAACDVGRREDIDRLFAQLDVKGAPSVVPGCKKPKQSSVTILIYWRTATSR